MSNGTPNPTVLIDTSMGSMKVEFWPDKSPGTVANFLQYVDDKFYDGTVFHRVIDGFMIQGGGFTKEGKQKQTRAPIKNEACPQVSNDRGTIAMARTSVVDSATAQFFINTVDNKFLNQKDKTTAGFGYCVFGKVTDGMDVADKISKVQTGQADAPVQTVLIKSIKRG